MSRYVIVLLIFISQLSQAQIIRNDNCQAFSDRPFFSEEFIKRNKIHAIIGSKSSKRINEVIKEKKIVHGYVFNQNGTQSALYWTSVSSNNEIDTSIIQFQYFKNGRLKTRRQNDEHSYYCFDYTYTFDGDVRTEAYCREENLSNSVNHFIPGKKFIINKDSFSYDSNNDTLSVKKYYNNYGKLFQKEMFYFDQLGYLKKSVKRLVLSRKKIETIYQYNERGLISETEETSNVAGKNVIRHSYTYDRHGNLSSEDIYKNGNHTTERQIVYNDKTMLLESLITREVRTGVLNIVRYDYLMTN